MKGIMKRFSIMFASLAMVFSAGLIHEETKEAKAAGETVKYTVASTSSVTTSGNAPTGSSATFKNTYTSNKEQITKGNSQTLTLNGYTGYKITNIVLSMRSNGKAGAGTFSAKVGDTTIASINSATTFNQWYDNSSYGTSYRNVNVTLSNDNYTIPSDTSVVIQISATVNSLYCQSFSFTYEKEGASSTLTTISYTGSLTKKDYLVGDTFDPTGLTITATYDDGTTKDVTNLVTWPELTEGMTSITGTYEDMTIEIAGITVTKKVETPVYTLTIIKDVEEIYPGTDGEFTYTLKDQNGNDFDSTEITSTIWNSSNEKALKFKNNDSGAYTVVGNIGDKVEVTLYIYTKNTSVYFEKNMEIELVQKLINDTLTVENVNSTNTTYKDFSYLSSTTKINYVGNTAGSNSSIQLRGEKDSGIVTVSAKMIISKITVEWNSTTSNARTLNIYASNTPYNDASNLYSSANYIGAISRADGETSFSMPSDTEYAYIGIRSNSGAIYLTSVTFSWKESTTANDFIENWNILRELGDGSICDFIKDNDENSDLNTLLNDYEALTDAEKAIVNDTEDGENNTIGNSIDYIKSYRLSNSASSANQNALSSISNRKSLLLIAFIGCIGLISIAGYYFINKKRLAK